MQIQKVTQTYNNEDIECAKITADRKCTWRFRQVLDRDGEYAWQFVIKAEAISNVIVTVGNKGTSFNVTTEFNRLVHLFSEVEISDYPYVDITFPVGTFYILHTQLEHGQVATDWKEDNADINQFIQNVYTVATQTADKFNWIVASGTSSTDFTLTDRTAELVADYINLNGLVAFTGLNKATQEEILDLIGFANSKFGIATGSGRRRNATFDSFMPNDQTDMVDGMFFTIKYENGSMMDSINSYRLHFPAITQYFTEYIVYDGHYLGNISTPFWDDNDSVTFKYREEHFEDYDPVDPVEILSVEHYLELIPNLKNALSTTAISRLGKLCYDDDMTLINGGKLATGTVTANKINVNALEAISANIGGFEIENNNLEVTDASDDFSENPQMLLQREKENHPETYGYVRYSYPNTEYYQRFAISYGGQVYRPSDTKIIINEPLGTFTIKSARYTEIPYVPIEDSYDETAKEDEYTFSIEMLPLDGMVSIQTHDGNNNELPIYLNSKEISMPVAGKQTISSIGANSGNGFTVSVPTSQVGTNPVVIAMSNKPNVHCYLSSISTQSTNTIVVISALNTTSATQTNVIVNYMIMKGGA